MDKKQEVIKHSAAIQIQNTITLLQRRAWNVLLANAYDELPSRESHCISIVDLARTLEFDSKKESYLKEALKRLTSCSVEWNVLDKDGTERWGVAALLAEALIEHGMCTYAYGPTFRRMLYNPRMYARLCLSLQNKFDSKHALALWELCLDYLGAGRSYGETPLIPLIQFKKLMGIDQEGYPQFRDFNQRVIKEPLAEINQVSDFRVTVEYQRQGRKVVAVKFKMRRKAFLPEPTDEQGHLFPDLDDIPVVVRELQAVGLSSNDAWEIWHAGFSVVEDTVRPAVPGEDADAAFVQYVREKIHLLQRRRAAGKVEHVTGFLLQAIRHNYTNLAFEAARQQEQQRARAQEVANLQAEHAEVVQARDTAVQALCDQLALEAPAVLEQAVTALFADDEGFRYLYDRTKSPLGNYQERLALRALLTPALLRAAPTRVEAALARYTARLGELEARLAGLEVAPGPGEACGGSRTSGGI